MWDNHISYRSDNVGQSMFVVEVIMLDNHICPHSSRILVFCQLL